MQQRSNRDRFQCRVRVHSGCYEWPCPDTVISVRLPICLIRAATGTVWLLHYGTEPPRGITPKPCVLPPKGTNAICSAQTFFFWKPHRCESFSVVRRGAYTQLWKSQPNGFISSVAAKDIFTFVDSEVTFTGSSKSDSEEKESNLEHYLPFIVSHVSKCLSVTHHGYFISWMQANWLEAACLIWHLEDPSWTYLLKWTVPQQMKKNLIHM